MKVTITVTMAVNVVIDYKEADEGMTVTQLKAKARGKAVDLVEYGLKEAAKVGIGTVSPIGQIVTGKVVIE